MNQEHFLEIMKNIESNVVEIKGKELEKECTILAKTIETDKKINENLKEKVSKLEEELEMFTNKDDSSKFHPLYKQLDTVDNHTLFTLYLSVEEIKIFNEMVNYLTMDKKTISIEELNYFLCREFPHLKDKFNSTLRLLYPEDIFYTDKTVYLMEMSLSEHIDNLTMIDNLGKEIIFFDRISHSNRFELYHLEYLWNIENRYNKDSDTLDNLDMLYGCLYKEDYIELMEKSSDKKEKLEFLNIIGKGSSNYYLEVYKTLFSHIVEEINEKEIYSSNKKINGEIKFKELKKMARIYLDRFYRKDKENPIDNPKRSRNNHLRELKTIFDILVKLQKEHDLKDMYVLDESDYYLYETLLKMNLTTMYSEFKEINYMSIFPINLIKEGAFSDISSFCSRNSYHSNNVIKKLKLIMDVFGREVVDEYLLSTYYTENI